jgi:teichuronic acid biosynthesis glycosyltransferase TuaG
LAFTQALNQHFVSIIVPAYRAATTIGETIESVRAQTHQQWELLIADDCSPDTTREVVAEWEQRDPRVRLIQMPSNGGPASARNGALAVARGRWIAFLDSDDLWLPEKLERSLAHALHHHAALVYTGYRRISADGRRVGRYISVPPTLSYRDLLGHTAIATSTVLIDRAVAGEVRMRAVYYDDFVCWLSILKRGHLAYGLDEDLMRYRVLTGSVSRNKGRSARQVWATYRLVEGLSLLPSAWHFGRYAVNAIRKYRRF